ncbi:uncharacterized protein LOC109862164, partial [Pseudomyrmex gracilis]|uniref:uncharacterized protein LOC109862164 n=1 Tax=Pseudomyrmex gracilis TaxID=219809 RepID=UPI0009959CB2
MIHYKHCLILGDFNADMCSNTFDSEQIRSYLSAYNLYLVPYNPTHHTRTSTTFLDLCLIDDVDKLVSFSQNDVCFFSLHELIDLEYNIVVERIPKRTITIRDMSSFDIDKFLRDLMNCDWNLLLNDNDIDIKVDLLNKYILTSFDKNAPLETIRPKRMPAPWLTTNIKAQMIERNKARRRWKRHKSEENYAVYKLLRNQVQITVRQAKEKYYLSTFSKLRTPNSIWKELRKLSLVKAKSYERILPCTVNELNRFFSARESTFPDVDVAGPVYLGKPVFDDNKLYWSNVDVLDVIDALGRSRSDAIGKDGLSLRLVTSALPCVLPVITHIFYYSLSQGYFPSVWKSAIICPIPKVKCPTELKHFRPISILCAISKALESIVERQMTEYL